jgi:predicted nucleotidyltransferase
MRSRFGDRTPEPQAFGLTDEQRATILRVAALHGAQDVRVFGSLAKGEANPESDIDLLVAKGENTSPWFPAGLILELEAVLGRKVDVVTENGLSPYLREQILHEAVLL